jgi:hypothetical protein
METEEKFKMTKFRSDSGGFRSIRYDALPNGKIIAFGIAGTDLTTMQFGEGVDFDKKSDEIFERNRDSKNNMAFEYVPNIGFDEVDTRTQTWFRF